jgi:hypothetical protein
MTGTLGRLWLYFFSVVVVVVCHFPPLWSSGTYPLTFTHFPSKFRKKKIFFGRIGCVITVGGNYCISGHIGIVYLSEQSRAPAGPARNDDGWWCAIFPSCPLAVCSVAAGQMSAKKKRHTHTHREQICRVSRSNRIDPNLFWSAQSRVSILNFPPIFQTICQTNGGLFINTRPKSPIHFILKS